MKKFSQLTARLCAPIALVLVFSFVSCRDAEKHIPFDKEKWKQADLRMKGRMVDDLLKRNLLIGKTRAEIIQLLGEPDDENKTPPAYVRYLVNTGHMYTYDMMIFFDSTSRKAVEILLDD